MLSLREEMARVPEHATCKLEDHRIRLSDFFRRLAATNYHWTFLDNRGVHIRTVELNPETGRQMCPLAAAYPGITNRAACALYFPIVAAADGFHLTYNITDRYYLDTRITELRELLLDATIRKVVK